MRYQFLLIIFVFTFLLGAQDKGGFIEKKSEYWDYVEKTTKEYSDGPKKPETVFKMDFSKYNLPKSKEEFKYQWHSEPVNQGCTGTCWSFSTTSYFESEVCRLTKQQIKLSPLFTVYYEYLEKARGFVESRGATTFGEGSEANAVTRIWKKYGIVPREVYTGLQPDQKIHDHSKMFAEMDAYLKVVKANNAWNVDEVCTTIKAILDHYITPPPQKFTYEGKEYTPKEFLTKVLKLNLDDYVEIMSLMQKPYYELVEYEVPDNWWHSKEYFNVPLDVFISTLKNAVRQGYTVALGGDVSEPGIESHAKVAMVPSFDIPSEYIDEYARQLRFTNKTTEDDHGIHLIGYTTKDGKDWFLIKDSGSGSYNTGDKGYEFFHEDYVKLKMLGYTIHKDALGDLAKKIK